MIRTLTEHMTFVGLIERFSSWGNYNSPRVILRVPASDPNEYIEYEMTANTAKRLGNRLSKYGKIADD